MQEFVQEYLISINANPALTNEIKAAVADHLVKFFKFAEARAPKVEEPTSTEPTAEESAPIMPSSYN